MADDEGVIRQPPGGLSDAIWGGQVVDKFDRGRRQDYFDALSDPSRVRGAAIAGAPIPSGVLAGGRFKNMQGIMRSLMLGNQLQGKDTKVRGGYGNPQTDLPLAPTPFSLSPGLTDFQPQEAGPINSTFQPPQDTLFKSLRRRVQKR